MFPPQFLEGHNHSSEDPPLLEFPEDDPMCFYYLCQILHHQQLEKTLVSSECIRLLVLTDKYDCTGPIKAQLALSSRELAHVLKTQLSLRYERDTEANFATLLDMIGIAYVIEDLDLFEKATQRHRQDMWSWYCRPESRFVAELDLRRIRVVGIVRWPQQRLRTSSTRIVVANQ